MSFDKPTRNRLAKFVADARRVIADEFTEQFQSLYGISAKGDIAPLDKLGHLDEAGTATAALLRERIDYLEKTHPDDKDGIKAAVARLAREQAFTVLNRLAAIRMAEKRGLIVESVGKGYQSRGFRVFETVAGSALGDTYHRYRRYLFCLFDELAIDLGVLFDRRSPQALLFPREPALLALLDLFHAADLERLWAEDETIGWIYQYYNDPEERKKMRAESAAPRNSRELAVRNQFFTPRYVVEFLTDNTLGRIWYEMSGGATSLKDQCRYLVRRPNEIFLAEGETAPETPDQEGLSQEELLKQPVYIPHRPLKDPRDIRLLDPACGSMHFGLYAFDLFETIYEEAWDSGSCRDLREGYASKDDFLKDVPRLIIEHNIHGIDIDPRATQIAGLSLWLRAQKAWQARGVKPADRPRVRRSNIVCAEPMPGSPEMLEEFVATLEPKETRSVLGELVKTVFDKMQLAGEAGSLLKIEEEIRTAIDTARKEWLKQQDDLLTRKDGSQEEFFNTAEQQVIDALRAYAEQADADSYQRRLFADDAARGFAFIDLCRKRYDAVVMNPPFGDAVSVTEEIFQNGYVDWCKNLASAFVQMALERLEFNGQTGVVADRTIIVKSSYEGFRRRIYSHLHCLADLGWEVLDANVEVTSFALSKQSSPIGAFFDQRQMLDKQSELLGKIQHLAFGTHIGATFSVSTDAIASLPNCAFAYDLPSVAIRVFERHPSLKKHGHRALQGHNLSMAQFGRLAWEVPPPRLADKSFIRMYKGGEFCKYLQPSYEAALWFGDGAHLRGHSGTRWGNEKYQEKRCIGYGKRGDFLDAHVVQDGHIFTVEGLVVSPRSMEDAWWLLAILNSSACSYLLHFYSGQHKMSGYLDLLPIPEKTAAFEDCVQMARELYDRKRFIDGMNELSAEFVTLSLRVGSDHTLQAIGKWINDERRKTKDLDHDLDAEVSKAYGIDHEWLRTDEFVKTQPTDVLSIALDAKSLKSSALSVADATMNYLVGTAFGRWDIRYATGERQPPELPDPFDPLPVCPPGMLQNAESQPAEPKDVPDDYPLRISWPGILVDDENHPEDIVARVREAIEVIWKDRAEAIEQEACGILGVKTLRDYFRRPAAFFADHLKRYSKSRRQAPIYWPLSTKSGSYTLWLYYHRLTDQTLHTCLADFLDPKLRKVQSELDALTASGGGGTRVGELREFLDELHDLRDEIERVIKLPWKPNLNDGVLITASPLHKLFRLPKWQKDLKACWDKLAKGEYDWAHLAHTIWPQRVEKACEKDRSIAIAHGREDLCKVEPPKPKKKRAKKAEEEETEEDEPQLIEED